MLGNDWTHQEDDATHLLLISLLYPTGPIVMDVLMLLEAQLPHLTALPQPKWLLNLVPVYRQTRLIVAALLEAVPLAALRLWTEEALKGLLASEPDASRRPTAG